MKYLIALLLGLVTSLAVQPMPGGVRMDWSGLTNDVSYTAWKLNPGNTNWIYLGSTTNQFFIYTNNLPILDGTLFGISAVFKSNTVCCYASDIGVAAWPPAIGTPPKSVRLTPTNGFLVPTGQWLRVSSDLMIYSDWLRFATLSNGIRIDHRASPEKPHLFISYFAATNPPALP